MLKRHIHRVLGFFLRHPLIFILLFFVSIDLFARAGGGGKYSGGRRSGGGGSGGGGRGDGGGDGLFYIILMLIELAIRYPAIGIPLALVGIPLILFIGYKSQRGATNYHRGRTIHRGNEMMERHNLTQALSEIQGKSNFQQNAFLERMETAFMKIQDAWCQQNLDGVRAFISDGIYERFSLQFQEQRDEGIRDHMEDIKILNKCVVHAEVGDVFETVTVKVQASAVDYQINVATGKRASGRKRAETFVEFWTFIRKPGAEERNDNGLIEGNCPNCGASLEINESAKCSSCQAEIKGGDYDWILSEITQECEWEGGSQKNLPGVDTIRATDPLFSVQQLEDRASVIFWRYVSSFRTGKTTPIRKMATDDFCDVFEAEFEFGDDGKRFIPGDVAVGAVDTIGITVSAPMDEALVRVRWSASRLSLDRNGTRKKIADSCVMADVFILSRAHGASAAQKGALSSAHCPNCGAPVSDEASDACDYCSTVLNDGNSDWVLTHIGKAHDEVIRNVRDGFHGGLKVAERGTPIREEISSREVAAWMLKVMLADGVVDEKERQQLYAYGSARHISHPEMDRMIETASHGDLECPEPRSPEEARDWLRGMARMALADGFVSPDEEHILLELGKHLSYSAYDIRQMITQEQKSLYQDRKRAMRQIKLKGC